MKRRMFLAALSVLLWPQAVLAQAPVRVARVGFLSQGSAASTAIPLKALGEGLRDLGWRLGENLHFDARYGGNSTTGLAQLAAELASLRPDLILCGGPSPALAVKGLGTQIPSVFVVVADPIGLGLAQSLARPGGLFTGLASLAPEFILAKQVELLRETVPGAKRIGFLTNPRNPIHVLGRQLRLQVAKAQGLVPVEVQARTPDDLASAFAEVARQKADVMYLSGDPLPLANKELVAELALRHRLPVMFLFFQHVESGGLMSYGIDTVELYRQAAVYVDKILKGAAPRDLPIEEPKKYLLVINLRTARALGLAVPQAVLLRADRVIE